MKPSTQERIERILAASLAPGIGLRAAITRGLYEQDKETRHACAETISSMSNPFACDGTATSCDLMREDDFYTAQRSMHAACINAQSI